MLSPSKVCDKIYPLLHRKKDYKVSPISQENGLYIYNAEMLCMMMGYGERHQRFFFPVMSPMYYTSDCHTR